MPLDRHLGQPSEYPSTYAPEVLVGIPREDSRRALGLGSEVPFNGVDVWNAYELSWLDENGKPEVATAEFWISALSPKIVESKSLKLYLNSLNNMRYQSLDEVRTLIQADLQRVVGSAIELQLSLISEVKSPTIGSPLGHCIDNENVAIQSYDVDPRLLEGSTEAHTDVEETLYSHGFKSNCPVTGQPDWATLTVRYRGKRIDRRALLRYVISFRNHDGFHEHCVERVFVDLQRWCEPSALTVYARYTRRGGIDINPFRSNFESLSENVRFWRQ